MVEEIAVVAAVWERDGRVLLGLRPANKRHGGMWEFPGGKVDPRETPAAALARELREELGVKSVDVGNHLVSFRDLGSPFRIDFYAVQSQDPPKALEHEAIQWVLPDEAQHLPLAPSDAQMIQWLRARPPVSLRAHPWQSGETTG